METPHHSRINSSHGAILVLIVTSLLQGILGCFLADDVFKTSCAWTMSRTLESRYKIDVCGNSSGAQAGSPMTFSVEGEGEDQAQSLNFHWDCMRAFGAKTARKPSYLVKKINSGKTLGFQCVRFLPLTPRVVRFESSELVSEEKKVNCASLNAEEHVLVASNDLEPVACPISGGYQVLMKLSDNIQNNQKCLGITDTYKPHLQFQCDKTGSSHVLADLGSSCLPGDVQMSTALRGETTTQLDCVDSWHENPDTSRQVTSVLMRVKGSENTFWCLNIERVAKSSHSSVVSSHEVLYRSILTFDGRCLRGLNGQHSVPTPMTMFGHLAAFIPGDDMKCKEASYLEHCETEALSKCQETTDCPKQCGRCLEPISPPSCTISEKLHGNWQSFSSGKKGSVIVDSIMVKTPTEGDFKCQKSEESEKFSLVQFGTHETCMPYHTCAIMKTLAPGLLSYQMIPAKRSDDGELLSCRDTKLENRMNMDWKAPRTTTLVQPQKLEKTPCNMMATMNLIMFNSGSDCRLTIHECQGSCHTFNISLEAESCSNQTAEQLGLMTEHTCLAVLAPRERGIRLTRSADTKQFLCWVQLSTSVFILGPENCSHEQVDLTMEDETNVPNPLHMLKAIWPQEQKDPRDKNSGSRLTLMSLYPIIVILSLARVIL